MTFEEWWINIALGLECVKKMPENPVHVAYMAWQAAQPQWRPISTAPTDEFILMYLPLAHGDYEIHLLAITEYGLVDTFNDMTTYGTDDFTHWCSVPKPPTKEGER